jgi:non-heme chloroperoxidase
MPFLSLTDGNSLYYKDWGNATGQTVVMSHGWPLSSDSWDNQMFFLGRNGYRVIAHDRRGHGRSSQPWTGNNMDTYADDLHQLFVHLDLKNVTMVGHSTGGGEVARFVGRHGTSRVSKAVLLGAVPPLMVQTAANPDGVPLSQFDDLRAQMDKDRSQFFLNVPTGPFFGFNRPGATASQGLIQSWWLQGMMAGFVNAYECIKAFSETDFTDDLKKMNFPVLLLHGDDDQIVPIDNAARKAIKLLPQGKLKVYPAGGHALISTNADEVNKDLLEFLKS